MNRNDISFTFGLFTILLFVVIFGFSIFSDGMFFDGIFYASIANNLAHNIGTFWEMQYTSTLHIHFHEQPPLAIFIQAQFFKIFGDSIYIERFYCLTFTLITLTLMIGIWKEVIGKARSHIWLPVLLWMCIPLSSWTYQNNLLEITMGAFDLCAIYFILMGCKKNSIALLMIGGLFTFLAFFSKGLQGLFPLASPLLFGVIYKTQSSTNTLIHMIGVSIMPLLLFTILYFHPISHESLSLYVERRLGGTFDHLHDTTTSHFYLLYKLGMELLVPILLFILVIALGRKKVNGYPADYKGAIFFISIGLTASLPLMVTLEQRPFYLATSFPYYAIGIGLLALPYVDALLLEFSNKNTVILNNILLSLIVLSTGYGITNAKSAKREQALIEDLIVLREHIPKRTTVSVSQELTTNWAYHAYFMRYCTVSLDGNNKNQYFLSSSDSAIPADPCYQPIILPLKLFRLYKCN